MRVIVGLSGGVDSAVAALLLKQAGHEVEGLFMDNWPDDDAYCTAAADFQDARAIAHSLGLILHRVDFSAEYRERVFSRFLDAYRSGLTPNPDLLCNQYVKFDLCLEHARRLGADRFATGHYARLVPSDRGMDLHKGRDGNKDQSYFLATVSPSQLEHCLFPLGDLHKRRVREMARDAGLLVHDKPDSTGICFIGERPFREFLGRFIASEPGPIVDEHGSILGEHCGLAFYTVGQRGGLGIGGRRGNDGLPWYVAGKDPARNALLVVQGSTHPRLFGRTLLTGPAHWLGAGPELPGRLQAKIRYRQSDQAAMVQSAGDGSLRVDFDVAQRAITPGQYAVFYTGSRCLGSAVIAHAAIDSGVNPVASAING
ncbi:MAG: tRNA 2-thiouridine(34) synthase MnmA [Steroidobacteraceae bacterium]